MDEWNNNSKSAGAPRYPSSQFPADRSRRGGGGGGGWIPEEMDCGGVTMRASCDAMSSLQLVSGCFLAVGGPPGRCGGGGDGGPGDGFPTSPACRAIPTGFVPGACALPRHPVIGPQSSTVSGFYTGRPSGCGGGGPACSDVVVPTVGVDCIGGYHKQCKSFYVEYRFLAVSVTNDLATFPHRAYPHRAFPHRAFRTTEFSEPSVSVAGVSAPFGCSTASSRLK